MFIISSVSLGWNWYPVSGPVMQHIMADDLCCDTHTHLFNGPLSGTTQGSRYQKGKTNLHFTEARDSEWQRHQLGSMQVCTSLQIDNHVSTPLLSFFTIRMPFLLPNQHCQSTEGKSTKDLCCECVVHPWVCCAFNEASIYRQRLYTDQAARQM